MKTHVFALAIGLAVASAAGAEQAGKVVEDPYEGAVVVDPAKASPAARGYSPYAGRKYPTRPLFGDTHHHTSNSGDAFMAGNRLDPGGGLSLCARRGSRLIDGCAGQAVAPARLPRRLRSRRGPRSDVAGLRGQSRSSCPDPTLAGWRQGDEGRRQGSRGTPPTNVITAQAKGTLPAPDQGSEHRRADHEVRLAAVHGDRREVQRSRTLHGDDRLRVDLGAGRQQPAPQRAVPRRQGQGRPGLPVLVLAERGPGEALGVDGPSTRRRRAADCSRSRTTAISPTGACSS